MTKYTQSIKDFISQVILDVKMNFRYWFKITKYGKFTIPESYDNIFNENFKNLSKWESNIFWPEPFHPENLVQWLNEENIKLGAEGVELHAIQNPKYFESIDTVIPNSVGFFRTKDAWQYGIFSFIAQLPKGTYLWPALWLSGEKLWPPEIDLLEGYSYQTNDYFKNKKIKSNIYFRGSNDKVLSIRGRSHKLPINVNETFVEYTVWWEKDFVNFYYNGYLVRRITNDKILKTLNEKQKIILSNGAQVGFFEDNETPLIVKNVKVYQNNQS